MIVDWTNVVRVDTPFSNIQQEDYCMFYKLLFAFTLSFSYLVAQATTSDPNSWDPKGWTPLRIHGGIPRKAVSGDDGFAFRKSYVCQAPYFGKIIPGMVFAPGSSLVGFCWISYGGAQIPVVTYSVLHNQGDRFLTWQRYPKGNQSPNFPYALVIGGYEGQYNPVYICRSKYYKDSVIGKYVEGHGCYFASEGKEHLYSIYDEKETSYFEVLLTVK
ncbi:DUF3421 domain-containing protein [Marinomonas agarivorans]|nr:DUF3421 domain-containing protein [Marinomonas agarivorans]